VAFGTIIPCRGGGRGDPVIFNRGYGPPAFVMRSSPDGLSAGDSKSQNHLWRWCISPVHSIVSSQIPTWDAGAILLPGDFEEKNFTPSLLCRGLIDALNAADDAAQQNAKLLKTAGMNLHNFKLSSLSPQQRSEVFPDDLLSAIKSRSIRLSGQMVLAGNAVVTMVSKQPAFWDNHCMEWHAIAVSRTDRTLLWDVPLPLVMPGLNGLSLTRTGDVLIALNDGRLVCIGADAAPQPCAAANPPRTVPGLKSRGYGGVTAALQERFVQWSPEVLDIMTPINTGVAASLSIQNATDTRQQILRLEGYLEAPVTGRYRFFLKAPRASFTIFEPGPFIACTGASNPWHEGTAEVYLEKGRHPIEILAVAPGNGGLNENGNGSLKLQWEGPDIAKSDIPEANLSHLLEPTPAK
jgi:hypothetical protein